VSASSKDLPNFSTRRLHDVESSEYGSEVSDSKSPLEGFKPAVDEPLGPAGVRILAAVPLFSGMSKQRLRKLSNRAKVVGYGPDRIVLGEGVQGGGSVFVLLDGTARVEVKGRTIGRLGPGDVFGEMAILDGRPRSASVVSASDIVTARLSRIDFLDLVRSDPAIALHVMEELAARLRECQGSRAL
jgi:CRP-like cAMP-binding protein